PPDISPANRDRRTGPSTTASTPPAAPRTPPREHWHPESKGDRSSRVTGPAGNSTTIADSPFSVTLSPCHLVTLSSSRPDAIDPPPRADRAAQTKRQGRRRGNMRLFSWSGWAALATAAVAGYLTSEAVH